MKKTLHILKLLSDNIDVLEKYGLTESDLSIAHIAVFESIAKQNRVNAPQTRYRRNRGRESRKKCRKNKLAKRMDLIIQTRKDASYPHAHLDWREKHIRTKGYDMYDLNSYSFNDILELED